MLKGHVFSKQLFGNPIFALFINTFLNGKNGVSNNYKNGMAVSFSGPNITIQSGAVCIQGRFLEEDSYTTIPAGTDSAYCKLVIEIDLDKQNSESEFVQGAYKIVKGSGSYPALTQTDIVKNNSGIYQYELARFRTSSSGILEFQDMRTFLDFQSIYDAIQTEYREILKQLQEEFANVEDGSAYLLKSGGKIEGDLEVTGSINGTVNKSKDSEIADKLSNARKITLSGAVSGNADFDGSKNVIINTNLSNIAVLTGKISLSNGSGNVQINYPSGFNMNNCVPISYGCVYNSGGWWGFGYVQSAISTGVRLSSSSLTFYADGGAISGNQNYKVVLMKIS